MENLPFKFKESKNKTKKNKEETKSVRGSILTPQVFEDQTLESGDVIGRGSDEKRKRFRQLC